MRTLFAFLFFIIALVFFVGFFLLMIGASFVLRVTRLFFPASQKKGRPEQKETIIGADGVPVIDVMVKDPSCGTYLPRSDAVRADIRGQTHYFCSTECLSDYRKNA